VAINNRWRFSLIEMQAILIALIENFEFNLPPKEISAQMMRVPLGLMTPMVGGRFKEGAQMPLAVRLLNHD
jgi:alkylphenol/PAH-inducible cytochrome P450 monooxygenase